VSAHSKQAEQLAHALFRLSLEGGALAPERVGGVLDYVAKHRPANPVLVLKAYRRLVAAELARGEARIEHAGPVSEKILQDLAAAMGRKYGRRVAPVARPNSALIAGLRVRVGDDVYEASAAGQLAELAASL